MLLGLPPLNTINLSCHSGTSQGAFKEMPGGIRGLFSGMKCLATAALLSCKAPLPQGWWCLGNAQENSFQWKDD